MRALIQRVTSASVDVAGDRISEIGPGLLVLLAVIKGDNDDDLRYLVRKVSNLRIFEDENGRMDLSILDTGGEALVVSQFTLAAETRKGNRPSFTGAEEPEKAEAVYERFMRGLSTLGVRVQGGRFGAMMDVTLVNDGPVTIMVDSRI